MEFARHNLVCGPDGQRTLEELARDGRARYAHWAGKRVAYHGGAAFEDIAAVLMAACLPFDLAPMTDERFTSAWRQRLRPLVHILAEEREGNLIESKGDLSAEAAAGGLLLFTSGTTGAPSLVRHSFRSLNTYARMSVRPNRWLVTYVTGTYAWVQVVLLGLFVADQALVCPASRQSDDLLDAMARHRVTAVSSTPTFWRYLLATTPDPEFARLPITQITLGGERADQAILDRLRSLFPSATLTHIFATTETGPVFAVSDGREGFPASYLARPLMGGRVELKILNDTLWVRSSFRHLEAPEWIDTGDLVEQHGDRVHVVGRKGYETINVGGAKVPRQVVEDLVRGVQGVVWARVYGVAAKFVGNLVSVDVVVDPRHWPVPSDAEAAILDACRSRLSEEAVPRFVHFLDQVPMTDVLKTSVT